MLNHIKILLFALFAFVGTNAFCAPPDIRVLVIENTQSMTVKSLSNDLRIKSPNGDDDESIGKSVEVRADSQGIILNGRHYGKEVLILNSDRKYSVGDRTFFGTLTFVSRSGGNFDLISNLPLERYLVGIMGSEISPQWPTESIKAQAVAARTYAMDKMNKRQSSAAYDIASTVLAQVYHGSHVEAPKAFEAVEATRGEVLQKNGVVFPTFYHSTCGGKTEHAHNVWKGENGPPVIEDKYCTRSPKFKWSYSIGVDEFAQMLSKNGFPVGKILSVNVSILPDSPRVENLLVEDESGMKMIPATEVRRIIGYTEVKSTWFTAKTSSNRIQFEGQGYGHGVGMCQWGAKGMADAGFSYRDILKTYYPDAQLTRAY